MLCADCDNAAAARRAEQVRIALAQMPQPKMNGRPITASFGVTEIQPGDTAGNHAPPRRPRPADGQGQGPQPRRATRQRRRRRAAEPTTRRRPSPPSAQSDPPDRSKPS